MVVLDHYTYAGTASILFTDPQDTSSTCFSCGSVRVVSVGFGINRSCYVIRTPGFNRHPDPLRPPTGFYHQGKFLKTKREYLNYKSAVESKIQCRFLSEKDIPIYHSDYYKEPLIKNQFKGLTYKARYQQKRKMRLQKGA